jgi:DNA-binding CsgD family transcriptional regulator
MADIVGRAGELAQIKDVVSGAPGASAHLLLHGDPGTGKTTLLRYAECAGRAAARVVLTATGTVSERNLPFAGLSQLFAPLLDDMDRLEAVHRDALRRALGFSDGPAPAQLVVSTAALALLRSVAPVVVTVDDLDLLDEPSAAVVLFALLRLAPGQGVRAVVTRRSVAATEEVPAQLHLLRVTTLEPPLDAALVRAAYPALPDELLRRVLLEAAGNPLALTELPAVLAADPESRISSDTLPRTRLEAIFAERALSLPPAARAALLVHALSGGCAEYSEMAEFSAADVMAAERLELITRESVPSAVRFRHPLVRTAVISMATPAELRAAHARRKLHYVRRAGGDLQDAADLAAASADAPLARQLLTEAGTVGTATADRTEAFLLLNQAGDLNAARRLLVGLAERSTDPAERDRALRMLLIAAYYRQDPSEWWDIAEQVGRFAHDLRPDLRLLFDALGGVRRGGSALRDRFFASLDAFGADAADPERRTELCLIACHLDALGDVVHHIRTLTGDDSIITALHGHALMVDHWYLSGEWDRAKAMAERAHELAVRHGVQPLAQDMLCMLGRIAAGRGEVKTARDLSRTVERWAATHDSGLHMALSARNLTIAALAEADYETAYIQATRIGQAGRIPAFSVLAPWAVYDLVEAAVRSGRHNEAVAHVRAADASGMAGTSPRMRAQLLAARALTVPDAEAIVLMQDALTLPGAAAWPFQHARIELALGVILRRMHRPADARVHLRRALDVFGQLQAATWASRAETELRAAGVATRPTRLPQREQDPALTAQELAIAQLAASGLSNKEIAARMFLSPRTIGSHLYRIFPKLGITSRSALRDALAGSGTELNVGLAGLEPATSATQTRRASQTALQPVPLAV